MLQRIIVALFGILFAQYGCAGLQEGLNAYNKKNYVTALNELQPLAEKGNANAQNYLGLIFWERANEKESEEEQGQSGASKVGEEYEKRAKKWFTQAAQQGNAEAQINLGLMYQQEDNNSQAIQWLLMAAKQNNTRAKTVLGDLYLRQAINPENPKPEFFKQALQWTLDAANQGNASAQDNLAQMYHEGWGVEKNYKIAMDWYRKAAMQGEYSSFYDIGSMYEAGEGVAENRVIADALQRLSAFYERQDPANSDEAHPLTIDEELRGLEDKMSKQEIAAAMQLTSQMEKPGNALNALDRYVAHPTAEENPLYTPSNGKSSLCAGSEEVLLSCVTKTRLISLCSTKGLSATNSYLQYRVERNGKLEFEFPKDKVIPNKIFTFEKYQGAIGGTESLKFRNGKYRYEINHSWDKYNQNDFVVNVSRDSKPVSSISCLDKVIGTWPSRDMDSTGLLELIHK